MKVLCIKAVIMEQTKEEAFTKGMEYPYDGREAVDNQNNDHIIDNITDTWFRKHFMVIESLEEV